MKYFDIEKSWQSYLKQFNIDEGTTPINQLADMKRAFLGGLSALFYYLDNHLANMDESEQDIAIADLQEELTLYWKVDANTVRT